MKRHITPPSAHSVLSSVVVLLALTVVVATGCAAERPFVWVRDVPAAVNAPGPAPGIIQPRDTLVVHVKDQPTMTGEFIVREDGGYLHPMLGNVNVAQRTVVDVAMELQTRLEALIVKPQVAVSIARSAPIRVNVVGEVRTPGVYELTRDRTVTTALAAAGWLTDFAARDRIFVIRPGDKELRIRFAARDLTTPEPHAAGFRLRDGDVIVVE